MISGSSWYRPLYELLVSGCAEIGRDPSSIRLSVAGEAYFPVDPAEFPEPSRVAISAAEDHSGSYADELDWVMGPTPADAVRLLEPLVELGVSLVTVYFHDPAEPGALSARGRSSLSLSSPLAPLGARPGRS